MNGSLFDQKKNFYVQEIGLQSVFSSIYINLFHNILKIFLEKS